MESAPNYRWSSLLALALVLLAPALVLADPGAQEASVDQRFRVFAEDYLEWYSRQNPIRSTNLGIHEYDANLPDMRRSAIRRRVTRLHGWLERLSGIPREDLTRDNSLDATILDHAIRAELLELEEIRGWRHNPTHYNRVIADGIASLIDRDFAPLATRLEALAQRLDGVPSVTRAARVNLRDVPRLWADLAIRSTEGTLKFLRGQVPLALEQQGFDALSPDLKARWARSHGRAIEQITRFLRWLERDLRPQANGNFRLGRELLERKLLYEEHIALSVDELRRINEEAIGEYRLWIERVSREIDADRPVAEVVGEITGRHPSPAELIPTATGFVEQGLAFVLEHDIVSLPTRDLPIVRSTPEYARSGFASMSTPGPFETVATEAYYNITNVDPSWSEEQQSQHLSYFNYPGLLGISVHEVMPGHFVQLSFRRQIDSDVRKVFMSASFIEGWAHYVEQMMVDEGLGGGAPDVRVGQLRRALQRHARWYAGLEMHAFGATIDEAKKRFEEIAFFAPFPARRETERGTYNPTYLYYALGRMQIFELREDYRRMREARGQTFSLREFHDRLLRLGLPLPLARKVMLEGLADGESAD